MDLQQKTEFYCYTLIYVFCNGKLFSGVATNPPYKGMDNNNKIDISVSIKVTDYKTLF